MFHGIAVLFYPYFVMFLGMFLKFCTSIAFKKFDGLNSEQLEIHNSGTTFVQVRIRNIALIFLKQYSTKLMGPQSPKIGAEMKSWLLF